MQSRSAIDPGSHGRLCIDAVSLDCGPAGDVVLGPLLLRRGLNGAAEFIRIFSPQPTAAFGRRDTKEPGFARSAGAAAELGFVPVVRACGGRLAAYHDGTVVIDHVLRESNAQAGMHERFVHYSSLHAEVLRELGLDARIGELPGEYCPGAYSVNAGGRFKVVGSAQRITRNGWLFSSIIQVTGSRRTREVLKAAYWEMGYPLDPSTIGSIEDVVPGVTVQEVMAALRRRYFQMAEYEMTKLPRQVHERVAAEAAEARVGTGGHKSRAAPPSNPSGAQNFGKQGSDPIDIRKHQEERT
jgi:octanoyl-[GcvH]:protein N-octanoyltransferase